MEYTIGAYVASVPKPFKTVEEAVEFVQERYPELSKEVIEKEINPKITDNGSNRPGGIHQETEESGKGNAKADKKRTEPNPASADKPQ